MHSTRHSGKWLAPILISAMTLIPATAQYAEVFTSPFFAPDGTPCVGDVNGDGHIELILTTWDHVAVYTGGPPFELQADWALTNPNLPGNIVQGAGGTTAGDADADGAPELLVGTWGSSVLTFQYAAGAWQPEETLPWMHYGTSPAISDIDGDSTNEVVVGAWFGYIFICRHGAGGYELVYASPELTPPEDPPLVILGVADTNGNSQPDVVAYMGYGAIGVFEWGPDGLAMVAQVTFTNGTDPGRQGGRKGLLYDVDHDGQTEIVYADVAGTLRVLKHNGTGHEVTQIASVGWNPFSLAAGDADGDGSTELLVGGLGGELAIVAIDTGCVTPLGNYGSYVQVAMGDLNGDGRDELVVGSHLGQFRVLAYGPSDAWARWGFEEYTPGPVGSPGTCTESWLVPPGTVAPEIVTGGAQEGVRSLRFTAAPPLACATEHDLTSAVVMPPSGLWEFALAFKVNLTPESELRLVVEDHNLTSPGGNPGPCAQLGVLHLGDRIILAMWDSGAYSDLSAPLGITSLAPDTWYQLVVACDAASAMIRRVALYVPGLVLTCISLNNNVPCWAWPELRHKSCSATRKNGN